MVTKSNKTKEPEIPKSIDPNKAIELLKKQIEKANKLLENTPVSDSDHRAWENTTSDFLIKSFGSKSKNINAVIYALGDVPLHMNMTQREIDKSHYTKLLNQIKMLESCIEQLETEIELETSETNVKSQSNIQVGTDKIFIVHGHNEGVKETIARFISQLDLEPIILHEQPNMGRTIIEKFEDYSNQVFAIVILTGDDVGKVKDSNNDLKLRARQNVIFELGYFIGKISRKYVCALYEEGVEIPSDYKGVLFIPLDEKGKWKYDLVKELKAADFKIDANKIF